MSYFPEVWSDDSRMPGYMSMFKNRDVNPQDFDSKMKFWTNLIEESCRALKNPCFTMKELTYNRFKRKDRIPAGMGTVLKEMLRTGAIVSVNDYMRGNESWVSWGLETLIKSPICWLLGYSSEPDVNSEEFLLVELVKSQANDLLSRHEQALADDPMSKDLIELSVLRRSVKDILTNERSLEFALIQLQRDGHVIVANSHKNNGKIVKFRDSSEKGPVKLTEIDTNYHKLKTAMNQLEDEMLVLEKKANDFDQKARQCIREGNKVKAKQMLRQKQVIQKQIAEKDKVYDNMSGLIHKISQTNDQKQVFDAYRAGVVAFKENLKAHGLSANEIDDTMDSIQDAMLDHEDISMAMSQGPSGLVVDSDGELEEELNDLISEDKPEPRAAKEPRLTFPPVPVEKKVPERSIHKRDRIRDLRDQLLET